MTSYTMRRKCAAPKVRRRSKLRDVRRSPERFARNMDFLVPETLILPAQSTYYCLQGSNAK